MNALLNHNTIRWGILALACLSISCEENEKGVAYVDGLASLVEAVSEPVVVTENTSLALKSEGIKPNDRLFLRSKENPNVEIPVVWGYFYTGKDEQGKYAYDPSQVIVQVDFNDQWTVGKWEVVLQRENERQVIASVDINVLRLKNEGEYVDYDDTYKGIIRIYAEGWQGKGTDYFEFVNNETNEVLTLDADINVGSITEPYQEQLIGFDRNALSTGSYTLFVRRWNHDFRQEIGVFDYFRIAFVDQDPITRGANGEYAFELHLDKIVPGDVLRIGYGNKGFTERLKAEAFDEEKQIYRLIVPPAHLLNVTFDVTLTRNQANLILGSKQLIVSE